MQLTGIALEHGMEIEQDGSVVPDRILNDNGDDFLGYWEHDMSGPRELEGLGPSKQVGSLLRRFTEAMRAHDDEVPWEWHNETSGGAGCGSHAHLTFNEDACVDSNRVEGMTIAWNTVVELTPFLAPFWCHDWELGFRSSVTRWASPQTTRYSQSTMGGMLSRGRVSRSYDSVTLNPSTSSKPVTIELRLNEAHPAFSLVGLTFLRRVATKAMRRGTSPKLAGDRRSTLNQMYRAIYNSELLAGGLIGALKSVGPIEFEEGRGIPGSSVTEFDSAWDVLMKVFAVNGVDKGAYDDRVKKLVQAAGDGTEVPMGSVHAHTGEALSEPVGHSAPPQMIADGGAVSGSALGPQNNPRAVWHTLDDEFSWDIGPEVA